MQLQILQLFFRMFCLEPFTLLSSFSCDLSFLLNYACHAMRLWLAILLSCGPSQSSLPILSISSHNYEVDFYGLTDCMVGFSLVFSATGMAPFQTGKAIS